MIWMHLSLEEDSQLDSTLVARMNGEQDIIFNSVLSVCGHGSRTSAARENSTASTTAMPPRPSNKKAPSNNKPARKPLPDKKKPAEGNRQPDSPLDTTTIPLPLQQLLLNVFQSALVPNTPPDPDNNTNTNTNTNADPNDSLDLKPLIQTIKSHLYNRDFDSAFTDANEELLRAYALRWSATRALGYAGVFKGVLRLLFGQSQSQDPGRGRRGPGQIVCVGGGAGAEIVALGGVWRDFTSQQDQDQDQDQGRQVQAAMDVTVTAVDIADWSGVVGRLEGAMRSSRTGSGFGSRRYPAPLLSVSSGSHESANSDSAGDGGKFKVNFQRADVLTLTDDQLYRLYNSRPDQEVEGQGKGWTLVTLMFTLNELFSTSMAKTTGFLLRTTDAVQPGSFLLVVDSPGSYSSLTLGKPAAAGPATGGNASKDVERCYPMKFLLDHTLLSVADGKWEKVVSEDSRWWRREADRLGYEVGEGAGLEDMRFQVHIYRRLAA